MSSSGFVASGLLALANDTQVGALQLSSVANLNQISTCTTTNNSCLLPASVPNGFLCKIRNDSASGVSLNVFPQVGGVINALAANAPVFLPISGLAEFISIGGLNWLVSNASVFSGNSPATSAVLSVVGATSLTAANNGQIIMVSQASAYAITLPAVATAAGIKYKFILGIASANIVQINATTGTPVVGHSIVGPIAGATINVGAGTLGVRYSTTCLVGDCIDCVCDGTNWFVRGTSASNVAATGIIFA